MDFSFEIGERRLRLVGAPWAPATVPANFRPFLVAEAAADAAAEAAGTSAAASTAVLTILRGDPEPPVSAPLSEAVNDLGRTAIHATPAGDWAIVLTPRPGEPPRLMLMAADLQSATLWLRPADPFADFVIDSMARIFFSQHIALAGDLIVHASAVGLGGRAYIFMGRSGTGKSTHSQLWLRAFPSAELLNDDCPMLHRDAAGRYLVCGTPWSGKTPCWRAIALPLAGIVRLAQAPANRFTALRGIEAFTAFIPGMSVMTADRALYSAASAAALDLLDATPAGRLDCLPDLDAAHLCHDRLRALLPAVSR